MIILMELQTNTECMFLIKHFVRYTAGLVGGLSTIAACAPSDKFLTMGAPLGMGLGVVLVASLGM